MPLFLRRSSWRTLPWPFLALIIGAGLLRGGVLWLQADRLRDDPDRYSAFARNLLRWGVYSSDERADDFVEEERDLPEPSAFRPPLYPYLLAKAHFGLRTTTTLRIAVTHWLLGMATVLVVFDLGRRARLGAAAYAAAWLVACDPILLQQSTLVMTETLAAILAAVALWTCTRYAERPEWFRAALIGGAVGLAALCRPTFLPWLALLALALLLVGEVPFRRRALAAVACLLGAAVVLAPWGWRNYRELNLLSVTTTHGGYTLWLGNNPEFYAHLRAGKPLESYEPHPPGMMQSAFDPIPFEVAYDNLCRHEAQSAMRAEPGMCAYACCYRLYQLVNPLPHPAPNESFPRSCLRYAVAAWYVGVYLLAGFGLFAVRGEIAKSPWIWGLTLCAAFAAVHTLYWTNLRMRAPLMPFVALVAAAGVKHLSEPFVHANLLRRKNLRSC